MLQRLPYQRRGKLRDHEAEAARFACGVHAEIEDPTAKGDTDDLLLADVGVVFTAEVPR